MILAVTKIPRRGIIVGMGIFVLLHGNWHDGSAWDGVKRRLGELGHTAHAPTLPSHGEGRATDVGYRDAAELVARYIIEHELRDVVLVGHSGGGVAISKTAELIADRVRHLVYVSGWVLNSGECILDMVPPHYRELFADMMARSPDNTVTVPFDVWRDNFINDADETLARAAFEQLRPEPAGYLAEPVNFTVFHSLKTPKSFILPTEDITLPRDDEQGWHPRMTNRLGQHHFIEIPGSHEVMFTDPRGLADAVVEACVD
jgi:pimeloyl-ACP methyl ester carboxylesterase